MTELITTLAVVFITAGLFLLIANQLSLSPIPFFLVAGLVTGRFIEDPELVELAQWGIAFLVFTFGFRTDFGSVEGVIRDAETAAVTQLVVVGPIAFAVATLFGYGVENAVYFAVAATLSSTIVGARELEQEIRNNLVYGRLASSVHLFDDLLAIGLIVVLSADQYTTTIVTSKIGFGVIFLLAALLVYRHGFPLLVRLAGGSDELVMMGSISILIAFIAGAEFADVSIVVGAFAAGIAVRGDDVSSIGVRNGIASIRDFFVAIFFVTLGALVSIPSVEVLVVAATLAVLVLFVNPLVLMIAFVFEGYDARTAFFASTSLNQVSELSLVVAIQAWLLGTITEALFDAIILAAAATMILTSVARRYEEPVYRSIVGRILEERQTQKIDDRSYVESDLTDHIVIVGYGRQGRRLVETCERLDPEYVVVENDPVLWDDMRAECENYVFGDAMSRYPLEKARIGAAALVVSTVDHRPLSEALLEIETDADLVLRTETSVEAHELLDSDVTYVSVPNVLASDQLSDTVEAVVRGELDEADARAEHLETLETLERYKLDARFGNR
ncbi:cation:proton antiporter domain-containing protein [Natrarchaeobius chitinivorans]|uniref:Potassium transporter Kef n=1 Tax=Natrarchaeobius chitinivorans TaxID=1679083 RepID=A0A3N6MBP1_NATCH|nr:cation:proton antiporter [Natrarchaeobius chitinivorans]RQG93890.1 potassium transporter Kef [Natrarchaeobius chitinivorans]